MTEFERIDIHELLPQRPPFVMADTLVLYSPERTVTRTLVKADNIFVDNGLMSAAGLMENMAQTCAARIGYYNKYVLKRGIQLGFIGAVRNFDVKRLPEVGETIVTTVDTVQEIMGMLMVDGTITSGSETLARSTMKIALSEQEALQN